MGFAVSQAQDLFKRIRVGLQYLHGRHVFNIFDRYLSEVETDLADLMNGRYLSESLEPADFGSDVFLPDFEKSTPHILRYVWDYFVFLYMSHKIQNIKRRQGLFPTILYLRGSDYEFAVSKEQAGLGYATAIDHQFQTSVLNPFKRYFNVLKALSPTDLSWPMVELGGFLIARGNTLSNVAQFARERDEGIFLNSSSWRNVVVDLFPSAATFLVFVSNRSQGLKFELESLLSRQLERNSILILDNRRFEGRQSFFEVQESLKNELYASVVRDACVVDDTEDFERLLNKFPFKLEMEREDFTKDLISLMEKGIREPEKGAPEIPFEFRIHLDDESQTTLEEFRKYVADQIKKSVDRGRPSNWPATLLFIELDVVLSLISDEVCRAAQSMARYAALADCVGDFVRRSPGEDAIRWGMALEQYGNMAMNVAVDALSMGEWNDFSDRREIARAQVREILREMNSALSVSVASASSVKVKPCRPKTPFEHDNAVEAGVALQKEAVEAMIEKVHGRDLTLIDLHSFHRKN
jgi:hypothetical protein